jgi:hypothetical protein
MSVRETSRFLGADMVFRGELCATCAFGSFSGLIGYRYLPVPTGRHIGTDDVNREKIIGTRSASGQNR